LTLPEAAEFLRLSIHALYKMAQQQRVPALKAGCKWLFDPDELMDWMKRQAGRDPETERMETEQ